MECRPGCAACCIAPSISSAIPGMPYGKAAGECCVQLTSNGLCRLFGNSERPAVCKGFQANEEFCGQHRDEALSRLNALEVATAGDYKQPLSR